MTNPEILKDLDLSITLRSSEADAQTLSQIVNVIVTSLHREFGLSVALIESELKLNQTAQRNLSVVRRDYTLFENSSISE